MTYFDDFKSTYLKRLGRNIKYYRELKGMTQEELASIIGYTATNLRSTMSKIETGRSDLPSSKLMAIAKVLDIPIHKLLETDVDYDDEDNESYYFHKKTGEIARMMRETPETAVMFDAMRDSKPEDVILIAEMLKRMK